MSKFKTLTLLVCLVVLMIVTGEAKSQTGKFAESVAVVLTGDGEGTVTAITPALPVTKEVLLVPYHVIKGAKEVQVRLKNGEIFDDVVRLAADERRDIAAIRISSGELPLIEIAGQNDVTVGSPVQIVTHKPGNLWAVTPGTVRSIGLADDVPGAGQGFQVVALSAELKSGVNGGVVFTSAGKPLGVLTSEVTNDVTTSFAVPSYSVRGLAGSERAGAFKSGKDLVMPITQNAIQRPTSDPRELLARAKVVYVDSNTSMFKEQQLINELNKRKEIKEWGWVFVTGSWEARNKADMVIELDHQVFTFDFTFTVRDRRTSIVITAGKVIIGGGAGGAPKMASKIISNVSAVMKGESPGK